MEDLHEQVITSIMKCMIKLDFQSQTSMIRPYGYIISPIVYKFIKLLIHIQTSMVRPLKFGMDKYNFIPHFRGRMIIYPCQDYS